MATYSENFSRNLKALRIGKSFTQKELAEKLGYSEKTVSKWECGIGVPDIEVLFELAKLFQINIEDMFCDKSVYYLGIDGGGTKTELILADVGGKVIRTLKTEACNPVDAGVEESKKILKNAIYEICTDIPFSSVYCFAGISGGTTADMQQKLKAFFEEFGFKKFANDTDNKNIIASGLGDEDGMAVIIGTGVCVFTQKNKKHGRVAGWGYLIDNGGSGYNLGRDALNAYFCAYDKTGPQTLITEEIEKMCPGGVQKVMGCVYGGGKKAVASFAPAVFSALEKGDAVADAILKRNCKEVAMFIKTAGKNFENNKIPVVLAGGLTNREIVVERIKEGLKDDGRFEIKILKQAPVYGALMLAQKLKDTEDEKNA